MIGRIKKIIENEDLNAAQFADRIGVQRSSISHILSERNKPSLEFVQKVLKAFPTINSDWLLNGKGKMEGINDNSSSLFKAQKKEELNSPVLSKMRPTENIREDNVKLEQKNPILTDNTQIERIVIFYKNGKFREYSPE